MPIVSVVIPVYNAERYLNECLDSLLKQTLKDIEIICVDDGSKDNSLDILNEYAMKDNRIKVVSQANQGAGPARNAGVELATGKYLSILDADDFFAPDMLLHTVRKAEEDRSEIVVFGAWNYSDVTHVTSPLKAVLRTDLVNVKSPFSKREFPKYILNFTLGCAWNKLFLRSFVMDNKLKFQAVRLADDIYFTMLALVKAERISILDEKLLYYRMANPDSQQGQTNKTPTEFFLAYYGVKQTLQEEGLYEQVEQSFVNRAMANCISRLGMLSAYEPYEYLYNKLKNEYFAAFEFAKYDKSFYYSEDDYENYKIIEECSLAEYLYKQKYTLEHYIFGGFQQLYFRFPFERVGKDDRIVLYGAGNVGNAYFRQIVCSHYCEAVLWVDKKYKEYGYLVNEPKKMNEVEYDKVVIAVADSETAQKIREYLLSEGVGDKNIIWEDPILKVL